MILTLTREIDPANILPHRLSLIDSWQWLEFTVYAAFMLLFLVLWAKEANKIIRFYRMERSGWMWSDTYQTWRCRVGMRPDVGDVL